MKNNDSDSFWFHVPILLLKIARVLTKIPSGPPTMIQLDKWGRSIKVSTDSELGRVRLDIITLPAPSIEGKKPQPSEDSQPKLESGKED